MNGVKFDDYDSWEDFGLILTSFSIGMPAAKRYVVDVPGRDGALDLTSALYENPVYENRTHEFIFRARRGLKYRSDALSELMAKIHGRTMKVIVYDDPDWYWYGHVEVSAFSLNRTSGDITITMDAEPYKLAVSDTVVSLTASGEVSLYNELREVYPEVAVTSETTITDEDGSILAMSAGTYTLTAFPLAAGWTTWAVETAGSVTITYQQGRL